MLGDFLVVNAILGGNRPLIRIPICWKPVPDARSNKLEYCTFDAHSAVQILLAALDAHSMVFDAHSAFPHLRY